MDASLLLVGGDDFRAIMLDRIRELPNCSIEVAPTPEEAVPLIHAQQPDLVLIQSQQAGSLKLCHHIKAHPKLAWIHCVMLDLSAFNLPSHLKPATEIADSGEPFDSVEALEVGADAFLWLPPSLDAPNATIYLTEQTRRLQAQIRAGLRTVRTHRELMRTNDILSAIALSDPLTELNNRRALDWEMPRQVHNARSRSEFLSVLMLDVDFFKSINDTYGHSVGDRALQLISGRLRHNLRFCDTLFRYGGEEFVIILSGTDQQEALLVGRRLCHQVSEHPFSIDADLELHLTISAGTATLLPDDDPKGISLLRRADKNLLQAKATGRNRVVSPLDQEEPEQVEAEP